LKKYSYFKQAHFIYDEKSKDLVDDVQNNEFATEITAIFIDDFIDNIVKIGDEVTHAVVSIHEDKIPEFLAIAYQCDFSIGFLPLLSQKEQIKNLALTTKMEENLDIALRDNIKRIDLVQLNDKLVYTQGIVGDIPIIGHNTSPNRSVFKNFLYGIKKFFSLRLQKFEITTANGQVISTAGTALIVLNHTSRGFISKIFNFEQSMRDGKITVVIISPASLLDYIQLLISIIFVSKDHNKLPKSIGYIQSERLKIEADISKKITFDNGTGSLLPLEFSIIKDAIAINSSEHFWELNPKIRSEKETVKVSNLPDKNEVIKYTNKHIPFFRVASEERFKDLFMMLRQDAKLNYTYIILMLLSTLLAAFGLFGDSTAVIIGAMLVAPLMTPIVSLAMGLLRAEDIIIRDSILKIAVGVVVALLASSVLAYLLPYSHITGEMKARVNPTLLDLGVAIFSGIAAAFSKSYKEISQNLAGVAIAVALVPPLAVAGIGLGYSNFGMFYGAFLLFFTNLVGIVLAAVLTFQIIGFSSVVKSKKGFAFVFVLLLAVSFPLYVSYDHMIERYKIANMLKEHRFIVNGKYIIVKDAKAFYSKDTQVLNLSLTVRESLNREDFRELKNDIQRLFDTQLFITTQVEYIL
jgi:uncharacterized hydrophobic protein (TIGR00271 family)